MKQDWNNFIEKVEAQPTEIKVGGDSPIEFNNPLPCPDFEKLLPEYFKNRDSSKLMDTKTGEVFRLSQSFIVSLRQALIEGSCLRKLWFVSVERAAPRDYNSTVAMQKGNLFEKKVSGANDYYGEEPQPILTATGRVSKTENERIDVNAKHAIETLKRNGIDVNDKEKFKADFRIKYKCFDGALDILWDEKLIKDLKYSGVLKEDKWSDYSWNKENVGASFGKILQACQYSLLFLLKFGFKAPFSYLVYSSKEVGVYEEFNVNISEERLNMTKWLWIDTAKLFQNMINENKFVENPSFENCKRCPVMDCKVRQKYRNVIEVDI